MKRVLLTFLLAVISTFISAQHSIPVQRGNVFTLAGYNRVDGYRWFDGDPNTKFVKVDWTADWRAGDIYPNDVWVVLDSVYNITSYNVYTNYETNLTYSLFFYDINKNQIGDSTFFNSLANGWRTFSLTKNNVRFIRLKTYKTFASNTGLRDVQFTANTVSPAPSIFPTPGTNNYVDVGVKAHGMNYLGDRFDKLDLQDDTIVTKVTKSVRWYESGNDFDYYPDTYVGRVIDGPLWLGRYNNGGLSNSEQLSSKLRRRGLSPMFSKTGGTIKQAPDPNSVSNNYKWLGDVTADYRYTEPGANPEMDTTWNPLAEQYYRFITLWGNNPGAIQSGRVTGGITTKGQNTIDIFETGNEESRWWKQTYYLTPKAYYEQLRKIYTRGKQADPNIPIYAAALPGFDTTYWRGVWWWHYWSGGNVNNFPADGLNFNMYLNNDKSDQNSSATDTWAISPEKWQVREDMIKLKEFFNRMFPGKQVQWTEFGYSTDDVSPYDVNPIGTKTDRQVQAEWTLRLKAIVQTEPFISRMYYYAFFQDNTGPFNSMAIARDSNDWKHVIPYPVGYALGQELKLEQDYRWYSTIIKNGGSTDVWVTQKEHISNPNKKLYKVWRGTDGNISDNYTLTGLDGVSQARLYTLRYDSWLPDSTSLTISNNTVTFSVSEAMNWIEVTKGDTIVPPPPPPPAFEVNIWDFTGYSKLRFNTLVWVTTKEINGYYYAVLRSTDGSIYSEVGRVAFDNIQTGSRYQFDDRVNGKTGYYYKLKAVGNDANIVYSGVIYLPAKKNRNNVALYPNPTTNTLTVEYFGEEPISTVDVYNGTGMKVLSRNKLFSKITTLDVTRLTRGVYYVIVNGITQEKFIKF